MLPEVFRSSLDEFEATEYIHELRQTQGATIFIKSLLKIKTPSNKAEETCFSQN
jgi:hypothetical protein